jgi:hypothetical protein
MENCNAVNDIREIRQSLSRIQDALVGNEYSPFGALDRIAAVEAQVNEIKSSINKVKYVALGYAMGGAGLGVAIIKLFA